MFAVCSDFGKHFIFTLIEGGLYIEFNTHCPLYRILEGHSGDGVIDNVTGTTGERFMFMMHNMDKILVQQVVHMFMLNDERRDRREAAENYLLKGTSMAEKKLEYVPCVQIGVCCRRKISKIFLIVCRS